MFPQSPEFQPFFGAFLSTAVSSWFFCEAGAGSPGRMSHGVPSPRNPPGPVEAGYRPTASAHCVVEEDEAGMLSGDDGAQEGRARHQGFGAPQAALEITCQPLLLLKTWEHLHGGRRRSSTLRYFKTLYVYRHPGAMK